VAGQNGAFTIHANPPEERQPTVHGFRERLRNFAFRVAAGLVLAGKLRYCVPVGAVQCVQDPGCTISALRARTFKSSNTPNGPLINYQFS
jgi:hypothetical protein